MKKSLLFLPLFISLFASAQHFRSAYDQLVYVNEQWLNQKDVDPSLKHAPAKSLNEQQLIQFHLSETEKLLRKRKVANLSTTQQAARINNLNTLHNYLVKGIFPVNDQHQNRQPYFIDKYNTYCAVGYLMQQSGGDAIAKDINKTQNFSYLFDINHPKLMKWAEHSGLSLGELALIQPGYGGEWPAAIMELHYNNTGTDTNEYIEVHEGSAQLNGLPSCDKVVFYNDSLSTTPYKTLLGTQMQSYYYSGYHSGGRVFYYTFASSESFADSGRIELLDYRDSLIEVTYYNDKRLTVYSYSYPNYPAVIRVFSIGEDNSTPPGSSLTYCGFYENSNWDLQRKTSTVGYPDPCTILPITLTNFSYSILNKKVVLNWETFSESNTKSFIVERTTDGINFTEIGKVNAAGSSSEKKKYAFTDNNPRYINHYRLRQLDADGKFTYSKMLFVKVQQANPLEIVQPVAKDGLRVAIHLSQADISGLALYDFSGRLLRKYTAVEGSQMLEMSSVAPGSYLLQLTLKDGTAYNVQFVK